MCGWFKVSNTFKRSGVLTLSNKLINIIPENIVSVSNELLLGCVSLIVLSFDSYLALVYSYILALGHAVHLRLGTHWNQETFCRYEKLWVYIRNDRMD